MPTMQGTTKPFGFCVVDGGATTTPLGPCGGIDPADAVVSVVAVDDPPGAFLDLTSEATIPEADRIELSTTDTTGTKLLVTWYEDR